MLSRQAQFQSLSGPSSECNFGVEFDLPTGESAEERAAAGGTMSCQELLALSGALSAALPTGQVALDSFFEELTKGISKRAGEEKADSKVRLINHSVHFLNNFG